MKKLVLVPLGALLFALPAIAQSAFDGTWKIDMSKVAFPKKPDVFVLDKGMYACTSCTPPYNIKADGSDQAVTGHPYTDSIAIKVVSDHQIEETDKKGGKVVATSTSTASADGKTIAFTFTDSSNSNGGAPVTGKGTAVRVAAGPAGSHAISGSWRTEKLDSLSDNAISWTYKLNGDEITMTNPTGQTYTAKLNGPDAPMKGDPGVSSVSVKTVGKNILEETDKRNGKPVSMLKMTVSADGKTAKCAFEDLLQNRTTNADAVKQ
ncbi:MAG TPA: hypothetical protein VF865_16035 [Acidobacteriaceae bacterium]